MFRLPGVDGSPDRAAVEAEKRKAKQNVSFTMKVFVAYVAFLRLGENFTVSYSTLEFKCVIIRDKAI